ncbi:hypothetical protein E1178_11555 [Roseibium hamelinense]|uniref:hypothetical protein n=1 Tax=Roseibium hamelinense TaxID=150831 RepID=UPI0011A3363C|nr:hypothetical protein [Roseibium hamelinense]MTI44242.1 hypothetical protein [Roseibium hamelinense]
MTTLPGPKRSLLTISDLALMGQRLAINCRSCGRFRYLKADKFAPDQKLSELQKELRCSRCRSDDVEALAVARDLESGYWPAERS